jgi:hypothetical protein
MTVPHCGRRERNLLERWPMVESATCHPRPVAGNRVNLIDLLAVTVEHVGRVAP